MSPNEIHSKRILISPLNWGMGHVSRCIGLIDQLLKQENEIVVACDKKQRCVFEMYFDDLTFIDHDGYPFKFGGQGNFGWDLLMRFSSLTKRLRSEKKQVKAYVEEHAIDIVISDHRYGFLSGRTTSIFVTHQFNLPVRWFEVLVAARHRHLMFKFKHIWIMDTETFDLAGKLSVSGNEKQVSYIGAYSRFSRYDIPAEKNGASVLLISGPTVYGQQLLDSYLKDHQGEELIVIASNEITVPEGIQKIENNWLEQDQAILNAKKLISRSGYSTIMDLQLLKTDSELIPTPGQREQEYLLKFHSE